MGKLFDQITSELAAWIGEQRMFFVATAPLAREGLLNCSPKGMDTFRILGPTEVSYLDLTGSGIETTAHLKENGRIVFMFCAFEGPPKIIRLHGTGQIARPGEDGFEQLRALFPEYPGARSVIRATLHRISDSCGYAVPQYDYAGERDTLVRWTESKGSTGIVAYRSEKNARSLDGLPGVWNRGHSVRQISVAKSEFAVTFSLCGEPEARALILALYCVRRPRAKFFGEALLENARNPPGQDRSFDAAPLFLLPKINSLEHRRQLKQV